MRRLGILALLAVLWLALGQGPLAAAERGPTLITVTGAVSKTNRPAFSTFADRFFAHHKITFKSGCETMAGPVATGIDIVINSNHEPRPRRYGHRLRQRIIADCADKQHAHCCRHQLADRAFHIISPYQTIQYLKDESQKTDACDLLSRRPRIWSTPE